MAGQGWLEYLKARGGWLKYLETGGGGLKYLKARGGWLKYLETGGGGLEEATGNVHPTTIFKLPGIKKLTGVRYKSCHIVGVNVRPTLRFLCSIFSPCRLGNVLFSNFTLVFMITLNLFIIHSVTSLWLWVYRDSLRVLFKSTEFHNFGKTNNCLPDAFHIAGYWTVTQRGGFKEKYTVYGIIQKNNPKVCNLRVHPLRHEIVSVCLFKAQLFARLFTSGGQPLEKVPCLNLGTTKLYSDKLSMYWSSGPHLHPPPPFNTYRREYWMIYRGARAFSRSYDLAPRPPPPPHPPLSSESFTSDTQENWKKKTTSWRERGEEGGRGAESYTTAREPGPL